ncbi:peptide chain release factor N(5)-glutamine methyltransferase [Caldimonas thermodepolymerans]|jgi:protein-(glutamine-N5) methyltransferase, release factor-specific|uniref:Release factor glutamine methyltransferase n=1 Tax=Caldimonas thermodepolymerans TaxID=215580 RepID=A0A2S5T1X9_9BURK|nr:peptide chain release factor N(5)-glutamine methyltransferase [Caldimonas thermodepolymerans]PPE69025.1 peptide chain release factor N(5)-glutamine methyltransferase [Caldimonas thermodepolymerans]QPC32324.1 peptide chain release factor N(5)-glutamine methyltransferase [Caldimonas thermodepolymerans]RDH98222.1 [protein release factor]-glutamine N5-methyltransferase [Caldimonas thermodepolymerans]TCP08001.1 [protein release factor]-glutamine N5-methyltransferase [Caldimonas thermodepolymerans
MNDDARARTTVAQAWQAAVQRGLERIDAQALLAHVLDLPPGRARAWLLAHDTDPLPPAQLARYEALVQRRATGEPLAYLVGTREFYGLTLAVTPAVLVPRPDTETLVDWAVELLRPLPAPRVADLGTGSGAIALALKHSLPQAEVSAVDLSAEALAVARANGERLGLAVQWLHGSWLEPLAGRRLEMIVSNPPYIADGDPHLPALQHEPERALTSGPDGLDDLRRIVAAAPHHLLPGGWLLLEHGHDQAEAVQALLREAGFQRIQTRHDLGHRPRCTGGRWN